MTESKIFTEKPNPILYLYLYHWKSENPDSYYRFYKDKPLNDLNKEELKELIRLTSIHETLNLDK